LEPPPWPAPFFGEHHPPAILSLIPPSLTSLFLPYNYRDNHQLLPKTASSHQVETKFKYKLIHN
jgi:hypothetical protein